MTERREPSVGVHIIRHGYKELNSAEQGAKVCEGCGKPIDENRAAAFRGGDGRRLYTHVACAEAYARYRRKVRKKDPEWEWDSLMEKSNELASITLPPLVIGASIASAIAPGGRQPGNLVISIPIFVFFIYLCCWLWWKIVPRVEFTLWQWPFVVLGCCEVFFLVAALAAAVRAVGS